MADTTAEGVQNVVERINGKLGDWNAGGNLEDFPPVSVSIGVAEWLRPRVKQFVLSRGAAIEDLFQVLGAKA